MTPRISIYPGTFDPLTFGHIDIIERAAQLGNQLIVAVAENSAKQPLFTLEERTEIVAKEVQRINKTNNFLVPVLVKNFSGLLTDFADRQGAHLVIRGLRAVCVRINFNLVTKYSSAFFCLASDLNSRIKSGINFEFIL